MTTDQTAPATKQDIQSLMEQIGTYYDQLRLEMEERLEMHSRDIKLYFDAAVENFRSDVVVGAHTDKLAVL